MDTYLHVSMFDLLSRWNGSTNLDKFWYADKIQQAIEFTSKFNVQAQDWSRSVTFEIPLWRLVKTSSQ